MYLQPISIPFALIKLNLHLKSSYNFQLSAQLRTLILNSSILIHQHSILLQQQNLQRLLALSSLTELNHLKHSQLPLHLLIVRSPRHLRLQLLQLPLPPRQPLLHLLFNSIYSVAIVRIQSLSKSK